MSRGEEAIRFLTFFKIVNQNLNVLISLLDSIQLVFFLLKKELNFIIYKSLTKNT